MPRSSSASRSTSRTSLFCPNLSRSRNWPRRRRWRSTMRRTGRVMADDRRILLVEDDVLIGMMLVDMLDVLGYPEPAQAAADRKSTRMKSIHYSESRMPSSAGKNKEHRSD